MALSVWQNGAWNIANLTASSMLSIHAICLGIRRRRLVRYEARMQTLDKFWRFSTSVLRCKRVDMVPFLAADDVNEPGRRQADFFLTESARQPQLVAWREGLCGVVGWFVIGRVKPTLFVVLNVGMAPLQFLCAAAAAAAASDERRLSRGLHEASDTSFFNDCNFIFSFRMMCSFLAFAFPFSTTSTFRRLEHGSSCTYHHFTAFSHIMQYTF